MPNTNDFLDSLVGTTSVEKTQQNNTNSFLDNLLTSSKKETVSTELPDNIPRPGAIPTPRSELPGARTPFVQAKEFVSNLPTEWNKSLSEKSTEAGKIFGEGLSEIKSNQPASGLAKITGGGLGLVVSPISATIHTLAGEPATKFGGPKFGSKVETALESGLPGGKIAKTAIKTMPTNKAISTLVDTIGKENLSEVIQRLRGNPRLSVMDVAPGVKEMGQKLATNEGHRNKFEKFVDEATAGAKGAVESAYNDAMGVPVNVLEKINQLRQAAKDVGTKEINPAIKSSNPVDLTNVISHIDEKLKPGINSVISAGEPLPLGDIEKPLTGLRKYLTDNKSVRTDADSLHQIQSAIRAKADDLLNSSNGQDRQIGYALMNVRNKIVDAIDEASGGKYKPALSKFRDEKQIEDAFEKGQLITRNRPSEVTDRPEFWQQWIDNASPQQLDAAREGARIAVDQQVNGFRNIRGIKGTEIPQVEFNKDKLKMLFDKDEINKMFKTLRDERDIAQRNQDLLYGSQTAMRMKGSKAIELPEKTEFGKFALPAAIGEIAMVVGGAHPGIASGAVLGLKGLSTAKDWVKLKLAESRNKQLTNMLTATGNDREELINILSQHLPKAKQSILERAQSYTLPIIGP